MTGKYDIQKIQFTGFIAQEVEAAAKKMVMILVVLMYQKMIKIYIVCVTAILLCRL